MKVIFINKRIWIRRPDKRIFNTNKYLRYNNVDTLLLHSVVVAEDCWWYCCRRVSPSSASTTMTVVGKGGGETNCMERKKKDDRRVRKITRNNRFVRVGQPQFGRTTRTLDDRLPRCWTATTVPSRRRDRGDDRRQDLIATIVARTHTAARLRVIFDKRGRPTMSRRKHRKWLYN